MKLVFYCIGLVALLMLSFIVGMALCNLAAVPWYWAWLVPVGIIAGGVAKIVDE